MKSYKEICQEIEALKRQAEEARRQELAVVIAEVRAKIAEFGLSAADCGFAGGGSSGKGKRTPGTPKYRHPSDPSLTWAGRGRVPTWLAQLEAEGVSRDSFRI